MGWKAHATRSLKISRARVFDLKRTRDDKQRTHIPKAVEMADYGSACRGSSDHFSAVAIVFHQELPAAVSPSSAVDPNSGLAVDAMMEQSIGNSILDNSTVSAFRRWRFKPGTPAQVHIPITFVLTGAHY